MLHLLAIAALSLTAVEVGVQPLSGTASKGNLVSLSAEKLVLKTAEGDREFPLHNLVSVTPLGDRLAGVVGPVRIQLVDGSHFGAADYSVTKSKAQVTLVGGEKVAIATRSIHSVRWKMGGAIIDRQWENIVQAKRNGDVAVIRKANAIDSYTGVVFDVTAENVQFDFNNNRIALPRARVEGLIYFHAAGRELPASICWITDVDGGRWNVKTLQLAGEKIQLTSTAGVKVELLLERLTKIDFSGGKIVYLSDLEPVSMNWKPYFPSLATPASLEKLYRPRRDQSFDGGKLMLNRTKPYEKGLAIHSRTKIVYRLPDKFSQLLADVGIDDRMGEAGNVRLVISGDGKLLYEATVTGKDKQTLALNIDISGVRRLTILVDFGDKSDIGDHLNLCDVRVKK